jgi:hypothetical protein
MPHRFEPPFALPQFRPHGALTLLLSIPSAGVFGCGDTEAQFVGFDTDDAVYQNPPISALPAPDEGGGAGAESGSSESPEGSLGVKPGDGESAGTGVGGSTGSFGDGDGDGDGADDPLEIVFALCLDPSTGDALGGCGEAPLLPVCTTGYLALCESAGADLVPADPSDEIDFECDNDNPFLGDCTEAWIEACGPARFECDVWEGTTCTAGTCVTTDG